MKDFLKSSVSALVLLGIISIANPSQAMEEEDGNSKAPPTNSSFSSSASGELDIPEQENIYQKLRRYPDILGFVLFHRGIDPETTKNTALVCKTWHDLIGEQKRIFRDAARAKDPQTSALLHYLVHASALDIAHDLLIGQSNNTQFFSHVLHKTPSLHPLLREIYLQLDPLDYEKVGVAGQVIKNSEAIKDYLIDFSGKSSFKSSHFQEIIEVTENLESIKQYLMILKLLALSEVESAKNESAEWDGAIYQYLNPYVLDATQLHNLPAKSSLFTHPLWSVYTLSDVTGKPAAPQQFYILYTLMNKKRNQELFHLGSLEKFLKYLWGNNFVTKNPDILYGDDVPAMLYGGDFIHIELYDNAYELLGDMKKIKGYEDYSERITLLDQASQTVNVNDFNKCSYLAWQYFNAGAYPRALEILKKIGKDVEDIPYRFRNSWEIAELILAAGDKDKLSTASECLKSLYEEFIHHPDDLIDASYSYTIEEEGKHKEVDREVFVEASDFIASLCALQIYNHEFDKAYDNIKDNNLTYLMDLECSQALMAAIRLEGSHMPKKLKKIFKEELECFFLPVRQEFVGNQLILQDNNNFEYLNSESLRQKAAKKAKNLLKKKKGKNKDDNHEKRKDKKNKKDKK